MKLIHFTFNNFFDYSIIVEQLPIKGLWLFKCLWLFNPNEFILTFPYNFTSEYVIKDIENLCKPLNIQFTTTIEITEDIE